MKMNRRFTPILLAIVLIAMLPQLSCKKSTATTTTLTVTLSAGVSGTPAAGTYTYTVGDTVSYSYTLQDGYSGLTVLLNNAATEASGTITIASTDQTLQVYSAGNGALTLTVTVGTGVTGTPAAGTYTYKDGDTIDYSYSLESGFTDLSVTLNSTAVASFGTITMTTNQTLAASAAEQVDVRGTWALTETYNDTSSFHVSMTFTGDLNSGTVTDSDGGVGTYTVSSSNVSFSLAYPSVTYAYSGTISDAHNMSGTSTRKNSAGSGWAGTWSAIKNPTARALSNRSSVKKGSFTR